MTTYGNHDIPSVTLSVKSSGDVSPGYEYTVEDCERYNSYFAISAEQVNARFGDRYWKNGHNILVTEHPYHLTVMCTHCARIYHFEGDNIQESVSKHTRRRLKWYGLGAITDEECEQDAADAVWDTANDYVGQIASKENEREMSMGIDSTLTEFSQNHDRYTRRSV